jgi:hypothetical protein
MNFIRPSFLTLVLLTGPLTSHLPACIWLKGTTLDGYFKQTTRSQSIPDLVEQTMKISPREALERIAGASSREGEYMSREPSMEEKEVMVSNDGAVINLLSGKVDQGLTALVAIEQEHPGFYFTAANMGTAYELHGDDENALQWISEGIKRNPASHMYAEWLHENILKAKIKLKSDPNWLEKNRILGFDPETMPSGEAFKWTTSQGVADEHRIQTSLMSQLAVRAIFIKPKDMIMSHLLKEAAEFELHHGLVEESQKLLDLSVVYGMPEENVKDIRSRGKRAILFYQVFGWTARVPAVAWGIIVVIFLTIIFRKKLRLSGSSPPTL